MRKEIKVDGMTCGICVATIKEKLENIPYVNQADVNLSSKSAVLDLKKDVSIQTLREAVGSKYGISPLPMKKDVSLAEELPEKNITTYKPLLLIIFYILMVTVLVQYPLQSFDYQIWMRYFMAGFFLVFSFFKMLNLQGFADSYSMYDIVAKKWKPWAYIYAFIELGLGVFYLVDYNPIFTNWVTIIVLGVSSIGVIQSVLDKKKIKCACLGDVFNLPMSTITIIEDLAMVFMSAMMLINLYLP